MAVIRIEGGRKFKLEYSTNRRFNKVLIEIKKVDKKLPKRERISNEETSLHKFEISIREQIKRHKFHKKNK